jgi:hypothetical protein
MNRIVLTTLLLTTTLVAIPPALACGDGLFNMGGGLRYQGYLAPRPATVLVYDNERTPSADRIAVYRGLVRAGHTLSIAHSVDELSQALHERRYDVVIAGLEEVGKVTAQTSAEAATPTLLPVIERSQRNAPAVRDHFSLFLLDGASLGQYLKVINQALSLHAS